MKSPLLSALCSSAVLLLAAPAHGLETEGEQRGSETHAVYLLITYKVAAKERPALWDYSSGSWLRRLAGWQQEGKFQGFRLLVNSYVEDYSWDAMAILEFKEYSQLDRWTEIEKSHPGGLDREGLSFISPEHSYIAKGRFRGQAAGNNPNEGVYFAIPYQYHSEGEYDRYAQVYVLPQFEGWIEEGILNGYEVFMNLYMTGKPWDVLILLQYRDTASFGERDDVKWKVRSELESNPGWKLISDNKLEFRDELETIIAEPVKP